MRGKQPLGTLVLSFKLRGPFNGFAFGEISDRVIPIQRFIAERASVNRILRHGECAEKEQD
ncbi:Uncharacterised protein [Vibrio cholerae]|nr:Uncharacterised protein [Vibrio cholerae]CSC21047.1 Uncharacterised protein [Vibrio cholerae]CSC59717.1 Uncharacterised protein [Vibrio cholerae]CSC60168.1 Uncharacterised protein [Vibrio cholerae]